jgi:hypothetical protein
MEDKEHTHCDAHFKEVLNTSGEGPSNRPVTFAQTQAII